MRRTLLLIITIILANFSGMYACHTSTFSIGSQMWDGTTWNFTLDITIAGEGDAGPSGYVPGEGHTHGFQIVSDQAFASYTPSVSLNNTASAALATPPPQVTVFYPTATYAVEYGDWDNTSAPILVDNTPITGGYETFSITVSFYYLPTILIIGGHEYTPSAFITTTCVQTATPAPGTPFPVELSSFKGKAHPRGNVLTWTTSSEINSSHFEIESSTDGRSFEYIGMIKAAGSSADELTYQFNDNDARGTVYYRLKQVDLDGTFEYSETLTIQRKSGIENIHLFPNPTSDRMNIRIENPDVLVDVEILDASGKSVLSMMNIQGNESFDVSSWVPGIYFMVIRDNEKIRHERWVVK